MFQFKFKIEEEAGGENGPKMEEDVSPDKKWLQAKPHSVTRKHLQAVAEDNVVEEIVIAETQMKYLSMATAVERLKKEDLSANILPVFTNNTDLVPAVYEGGLKIWECTWDLLAYLATLDIDFKQLRVMEIGCGAGLPAIYTMLHGAHVTLQDYNEEVIHYITIPNVLLNAVDFSAMNGESKNSYDAELRHISSQCHFFSGDWGELAQLFAKGTDLEKEDCKFDLILTSETIYNAECHEKLLSLMTNCLKPHGKILLAAKSYYFGVGGGILQFCDLLKKKGNLDFKTVYTNERGVKREILEIRLKSPVENMELDKKSV